MKILKAVALAGVMACAGGAYAEESYAPEANDFSVEMQFNPFANSFNTFRIDQLKARWYFSDKDALRIGLGFGVSTHKDVSNPEKPDLWTKDNKSNFNIELGYERNVYSYKRINLYAGAGLSCDINRESRTAQLGFTSAGGQTQYVTQKQCNTGDSYNAFFAKAFTGIDFFVYKGLYFGAELGLKVGIKNYVSSYTKGGMDGTYWDKDLESAKGPNSTDFALSLYAEPAIRLGWQF